MGRLRELQHTADVGFRAEAASPEELFELAAEGLVRALGLEGGPPVEGEPERIELTRPDPERLLVAWLRELLARAQSEGTVPSPAVEAVALEGGIPRLEARIRWSPAASGPVREIKGVTYHGLELARDADGWHASVVLDV